MFKKIMYLTGLVSVVCISSSVTAAEPAKQNGPMILSQGAMDQITAGFSANVDVNAEALSPVLAFTKTTAIVLTAATSDDPATSGMLAVSGGIAQAVGAEGDTTTSVTPTTDLAGLGILSQQVGIHSEWGGVEINGATSIAIGSLIVNPF